MSNEKQCELQDILGQIVSRFDSLGELREENAKLQQENAELLAEKERLREALKFYADEDNNRHKEAFTVGQFERMSQVAQDEGYLARKALEVQGE